MNFERAAYALATVFFLSFACAADLKEVDVIAQTLAPSGELKVGVYLGSPTSMVMDAQTGQPQGVAVALGKSLADAIHRPVRLVQFDRVAQVIEALKNGQVDMTFTNATAVRAKEVDFTAPLIRLELGVLVPVTSTVKQFMDVNDPNFVWALPKAAHRKAS